MLGHCTRLITWNEEVNKTLKATSCVTYEPKQTMLAVIGDGFVRYVKDLE